MTSSLRKMRGVYTLWCQTHLAYPVRDTNVMKKFQVLFLSSVSFIVMDAILFHNLSFYVHFSFLFSSIGIVRSTVWAFIRMKCTYYFLLIKLENDWSSIYVYLMYNVKSVKGEGSNRHIACCIILITFHILHNKILFKLISYCFICFVSYHMIVNRNMIQYYMPKI